MINGIMDLQTNALYDSLKDDYEISFEVKEIDYCGLTQQSNKVIIYYNPKIIDTETIAHELLHVWLNKFNYFIGNHIYMISLSDKKLSKIFSKFLCDYIENCLDHNKMYPKYLDMGYSPKKFLRNGLEEKCSLSDISKLNLKFLGKYRPNSINLFIGFLISIYADHVDNNYEIHLQLLKEKENSLFEIVTTFWKKWEQFDIENIDPVFNSERELTDSFLHEMTNWVRAKNI